MNNTNRTLRSLLTVIPTGTMRDWLGLAHEKILNVYALDDVRPGSTLIENFVLRRKTLSLLEM